MAVWKPAGDALYFWYAGDVWRWTPAGPEKFLPGVSWSYPTISPDGRHLAYAAARLGGLHDIFLADLVVGGPPRLIARGRTAPVFLDSTQLWYRSDAPQACGPGAGRPLLYDLRDGTESASVIDQPLSIWPGTSSSF
jgi:hypothetical protein